MELDWVAGLVVSVLAGAGVLGAMWASGWLHDEHGSFDANAFHWAFVVAGVVGGLVAGVLGGVLLGLAVVLALGNVVVGTVVAWGLAGGDGQSGPVAGLLGVGVFAGSCAAFGLSVAAVGDGLTARTLWLAASPALLALAAIPLTPEGRASARALAGAAAVLGAPAGLLWASTAVG